MTNTELIKKFYESFAKAEAEAMVNCYDDNIVFSDPAFGELKDNDTKNMWRMLLSRSKDIKITFDNVKADDKTGPANWRAEYVYSQTGRKVINKISAQFEFQNEKSSNTQTGLIFGDGRSKRLAGKVIFWVGLCL